MVMLSAQDLSIKAGGSDFEQSVYRGGRASVRVAFGGDIQQQDFLSSIGDMSGDTRTHCACTYDGDGGEIGGRCWGAFYLGLLLVLGGCLA